MSTLSTVIPASPSVFVRAYPPSQPEPSPAIRLLFRDNDLLVRVENGRAALLESADDPPNDDRPPLFLGTLGGRSCLADSFPADGLVPPGCEFVSLRALYGRLPEAEFSLAGYALQMLYWQRTSGYCPVCGHATEARPGDWGRCCPNCGHVSYPHVTPAVLILVHDGGSRILLGHKPGWGPRYSILAGFTEPGESLEDCVRREVLEEAGLEVTDLAYAGSQPWPYPHQLMIGFTARHAGGEVRADADELDDARWFTVETLPDLPSPVSLSRQMIDVWIAGQSG